MSAASLCQSQALFGKLRGSALDDSTHAPLADAVVYLSNTFYATSSDAQGNFELASIPAGHYIVIISRVGYSRFATPVTIQSDGTAEIRAALTPQLITISGSDITAPPNNSAELQGQLLFPSGNKDAYCLFGAETALPVGILLADDILFMFSLDPVSIDSQKYIRAWVLVFNGRRDEFEFDGMQGFRLAVAKPAATYRDIYPYLFRPRPPELGDSVLQPLIRHTVGYAVTVVGKQRSTFVTTALHYEQFCGILPGQRPRDPWMGKDVPPEAPKGVNPRHLSEAYAASQFGGILNHEYKLSSQAGVQGFLFFPIPGLRWSDSTTTLSTELSYTYSLTVSTPLGERQLDFARIAP